MSRRVTFSLHVEKKNKGVTIGTLVFVFSVNSAKGQPPNWQFGLQSYNWLSWTPCFLKLARFSIILNGQSIENQSKLKWLQETDFYKQRSDIFSHEYDLLILWLEYNSGRQFNFMLTIQFYYFISTSM